MVKIVPVKMGIANPCYKCGKLTKHKVVWVPNRRGDDTQVALCQNCDPEEQANVGVLIGKCLKCGENVHEKECGWSGTAEKEILYHYPKGRECQGEVKQYENNQ